MNNLIQSLDILPILNYVSEYASLELTKTKIQNLDFNNSYSDAVYLQQITSEAKEYLIREGYFNFIHISNINPLIKKLKIEGITLSTKDIIQFLNLLINARNIKSKFGKSSSTFPIISKLANEIFYNNLLEREIHNTIDDNGEVKDTASNELNSIRKEIKNKKEILQKIADKLLKKFAKDGLLQEEYFTLRDERLVLPVKTEFKRVVRGFIHDESATGLTTFVEPEETLELNNEILSLKFQEKREIERILRLLTEQLAAYTEELFKTHNIISEIDEAFAKAKYSIELNGNKVNFSRDSFNIINCRHPILIKKLGFEKCKSFSLNVDKNIRCLVVSGPNAGGKTVFMKTIGVLVLLSKVGFHFPMDPDSHIPFFRDVFIDIGDEQSIESDISTFGAHISRIRNIFKQADRNSLILLDEIGSGTDPNDGVALASGIIKAFIEKNSFVVTTTHHSLLKHFAANHPKIINCSFEFDSKTLTPTYKFIQGLPGSSYAFEIAQRQNLDKKILEYAREFLKKKDVNAEQFISKLQKQVSEYEHLLKQVKEREQNLLKLQKEFEEKNNILLQKEKELKKNKLSQGIDYLDSAKSLVEKIIKEIKETNADTKSIKNAHTSIDNLKKKFYDELVDNKTGNTYDFNVGDLVKTKESETISEIVEIDQKKNFAVIQSGQIRLKISLDKLIRINEPAQKKENLHKKINVSTHNLPYRYDIRGKRINEIELELIKYLDQMAISGTSDCEILHGKGDGILKKYVADVLKNHPLVKEFHYAPIEMGGDGITIVKFKE